MVAAIVGSLNDNLTLISDPKANTCCQTLSGSCANTKLASAGIPRQSGDPRDGAPSKRERSEVLRLYYFYHSELRKVSINRIILTSTILEILATL